MNILMVTNTYKPFTGGVERSVETFTNQYRKRGHRVIIIAPQFEDQPDDEKGVIRVSALQKFNGTDFSVHIPIPGEVSAALQDFRPDIVHSHHPFLLGATACRIAARFDVPLVYTFHTFYERYTHYVPGDSQQMKRFVVELTTSYANLAHQVFAPSRYVADILAKRGVTSPIEVIPTGVDTKSFSTGNGKNIRKEEQIPDDAFVVGFISRLAKEKNMEFLCKSVGRFLKQNPKAMFMLAGTGPMEGWVRNFIKENKFEERIKLLGNLEGQKLIDAYHAMDSFAFCSQTETQGLVIAEAMAAGTPVVAVKAPGVSEVIENRKNGYLLDEENLESFSDALMKISRLDKDELKTMQQCAIKTGEAYSRDNCAEKALNIYQKVCDTEFEYDEDAENPWEEAKRLISAEWEIISCMTRSAGKAFSDPVVNEN